MLILLDENIPHSLRTLFEEHEVRTTAYQGWAGLTNGALLRAADEAGFDAMITADQGIRYQQPRTGYRLTLIILNTNKETVIAAGVNSILDVLKSARGGSQITLDLGR